MTLSQASNKVQQCKQVLMDFERAVRSTERLPSILNGPQEMVSAATIKSVDILAWGLQRLDPIMSSFGIINMDEKSVGEMRSYAYTYGAAVRQRTTRQETTMTKHGTMPEMIYQRKLIITEKANFANHKDTVVDAEEIDSIGNEVEEIELEYDSSTNDEDDDATNSELDTRSTFLIGVSTRYGKAVRINNKYIS
eukprot:gene1428-15849_t